MKTSRVWKTLWEWKEKRYSLHSEEVEARLIRWAMKCERKEFDKARLYAARVGGKMESFFECCLVPLRVRKGLYESVVD